MLRDAMYQNGYEDGSVVMDFENSITVPENTIAHAFRIYVESKGLSYLFEIGQIYQGKTSDSSAVPHDIKTGCCKLATDTLCLVMHIFLDGIGVQNEGSI